MFSICIGSVIGQWKADPIDDTAGPPEPAYLTLPIVAIAVVAEPAFTFAQVTHLLPLRMKYIDHGACGGPEVLRLAESQLPALGASEVLIEVAAAGVNRPDVFQRRGSYPPPRGASPVLGLEVAGVVVARADNVTQWNIGDAVCALTPGGGYAEYCTAPASHCLPVPRGLSLLEAASLPENFLTVWSNVFSRGRLKPGESVLVHGGSSGIGLTTIQLAKVFGSTVFTTVGTDAKGEACRALGADVVINYRRQDWVAEVRAQTGNRGVDVILDMVGGTYVDGNLRSLAVDGRLVQISFLQESKVLIDAMPILIRRLTWTGSTLRPQSVEEKAGLVRSVRENIWPLLESGSVRPVIHATFPLSAASAAHQMMEESKHIGKIMLQMRTTEELTPG